MSGSCHLDRVLNVEIGVECQIFVIVIFFNCGRVLQFGAHSRYYKGALTQKRSFLVICTTFRSDFRVDWKYQNKHSTLNSSFGQKIWGSRIKYCQREVNTAQRLTERYWWTWRSSWGRGLLFDITAWTCPGSSLWICGGCWFSWRPIHVFTEQF